MKGIKKLILIVIICFLSFSNAAANTITFTPSPSDMGDLDHYYYYTWGINWTLPAEQKVSAAYLIIKNINDWTNETDILYVNFLNSAASGLAKAGDNQNSGNAFPTGANVILLGTYTDNTAPYGDQITGSETIRFDVPSNKYTWLIDGNFGIGIDPDCHYYNKGITFTIETSPIPEPTTMLLLGFGLVGLAGLRRKFKG